MMGFERVKERMKAELGELPSWIEERTEPFTETKRRLTYHAGQPVNRVKFGIVKIRTCLLSIQISCS